MSPPLEEAKHQASSYVITAGRSKAPDKTSGYVITAGRSKAPDKRLCHHRWKKQNTFFSLHCRDARTTRVLVGCRRFRQHTPF